MANFGLSSSSCSTSARFFSPPEKPSFTERVANFGSIFRRFIASDSSLVQVRMAGALPSTSVFAVRRKLVIDTPGTSTGYCMAKKTPALARSSGVILRMSSPSSSTCPESTTYLGWPASVYASVDLPDPFGPMMAWVSPELTVRFTPLRIGLMPSLVSTCAYRSLISRVDMVFAPTFYFSSNTWAIASLSPRARRLSITFMRCSLIAGMPISSTSSPKKPRTTSLRASVSGMPRDCR